MGQGSADLLRATQARGLNDTRKPRKTGSLPGSTPNRWRWVPALSTVFGVWTLGIHGGYNAREQFQFVASRQFFHDAAAALCKDGLLVAAAEEERFNRSKHTNDFPLEAIKFCLRSQGIGLADVSSVALTSNDMEQVFNSAKAWYQGDRAVLTRPTDYRHLVADILSETFGFNCYDRTYFVGHHGCHIAHGYATSGFIEALILSIDGGGDGLNSMYCSARDGAIVTVDSSPGPSLGALYNRVTIALGYDAHDEYKVMGLAPYGDFRRLGDLVSDLVELLPGGKYKIQLKLVDDRRALFRGPGAPIEQRHKDLAAALQFAVERALVHVLEYWQRETGHENLVLCGGFAQNSSAMGAVMRSNLFRRVHVPPAAYDAGNAVGAAIHALTTQGGLFQLQSLPHVFLGRPVESESVLESFLESWKEFVTVERPVDLFRSCAARIADGEVLGWVQGRAEFGARALGARSILADPRPATNKDRINALVKRREGYRPFAPSVQEEHAGEYFELPSHTSSMKFMSAVAMVRPEARALLGATTHVDGTARVQIVGKAEAERFWLLLEAFRQVTGLPVLLNTSFNNQHEPIVDSALDAMNCFLSTALDALAVGDYLVTKSTGISREAVMGGLCPMLNPRYGLLRAVRKGSLAHELHDRTTGRYEPLPVGAHDVLLRAVESKATIGEAGGERLEGESQRCLGELWDRRVFLLAPKTQVRAGLTAFGA